MVFVLLMMVLPTQADVAGPVQTATDAVSLDVPALPQPGLTDLDALEVAIEAGDAFIEFAADKESEDIKELAAEFLSIQPQTYSGRWRDRRNRRRESDETEERTPEEVEEESGGILDKIRKHRKEIIKGKTAKWDSIKGAAFAAAVFAAVLFFGISVVVGKLGK